MKQALHFVIKTALAIVVCSASSLAQDVSRDRLEREAAGQAAQADKLFKEGKFRAALGMYRAERASRKTLGDARYEALALRGIGICLAELGELDAAVVILHEARELDQGRDDKGFEGYDGLLIARAEMRRGAPEAAVLALQQALPKLDQAVDRDHEAEARICMAGAWLQLGHPEKAEPEATKALTLASDLGNPTLLAETWFIGGEVAKSQGKFSLAYERFDDARASFHDANLPAREADAIHAVADICFRLGRPDRAAVRFEAAVSAYKATGDRVKEGHNRLDLASVRFDLKQAEAAIEQAEMARELFIATGDDASEIEAMLILAQAHATTRAGHATAADIIKQAIDKSVNVHRDEPAETIRLMLLSSEFEHILGHKKESAARLDEAEALASKSGDPQLRQTVTQAREKHAP